MTAPLALDRLVEKRVALGAIREWAPPGDFIGLSIAPFMEIEADDFVWNYLRGGTSDGMAPARAQDAEAEFRQQDDFAFTTGYASTQDWALKDKYTASDVMGYRDDLLLQQTLQGNVGLTPSLTNRLESNAAQFQRKLAKDDASRKRRLDIRVEWLIMTAVETAKLFYNDGKIKFNIDYLRPSTQQDQAPLSGFWNTTTCDPIGDLLAVQNFMWDNYKITLKRGILSRKIVQSFWRSSRFIAAFAPVVGGTPSAPIDLNYLAAGFGPEAALNIVSQATGIAFEIYDSVYRTRPLGGTVFTNNRFTDERKLILLPGTDDIGLIDDTEIGFAKTITAPHPEGNWQAGYYEWEQPPRMDPWMHIKGSGIKAFPVFPLLEYSYVLQVLP